MVHPRTVMEMMVSIIKGDRFVSLPHKVHNSSVTHLELSKAVLSLRSKASMFFLICASRVTCLRRNYPTPSP